MTETNQKGRLVFKVERPSKSDVGVKYEARHEAHGASVIDTSTGLMMAWCGATCSVGPDGFVKADVHAFADRVVALLNEAEANG